MAWQIRFTFPFLRDSEQGRYLHDIGSTCYRFHYSMDAVCIKTFERLEDGFLTA